LRASRPSSCLSFLLPCGPPLAPCSIELPSVGSALLQHIYCHLMSRVNTTCCCVARRCVHVRKNGDWVEPKVDVCMHVFRARRSPKSTHRICSNNWRVSH
jgi:hypothetical protein